MRKNYGLSDECYAIGFVGNLVDQKNPFFLMDVFKAVNNNKNVKFFVVGDGNRRTEIEEYAKRIGIFDKVLFTGKINNVHEILQAMDLMLLPSNYEGLPNVVLEWQISGLPMIISDRITRECCLTDLVKFLPIDQGVDIWKNEINIKNRKYDRQKASAYAVEEMKKKGFDINDSVKTLLDLYCN